MKQLLALIAGVRAELPGDVFAWVNVSAIADFIIAAEDAIREAQNKESSRKHVEAMIKEVFRDGD